MRCLKLLLTLTACRSGHAAISFAGMVFLSLWLAGKLGILKKTGGHVWQQFIVFFPVITAGVVSLTRTRDYYHDFTDVLAGAMLGTGLAITNYLLKYPPLWKKKCEIPKRRWYEENPLYSHAPCTESRPSPQALTYTCPKRWHTLSNM